MEKAAPMTPKRRATPEHSFQAWVDRLIDRIVLPPMFVTGIDHASQMTDNARARMAGRGIKFGMPDVFVAQQRIGYIVGTPHHLSAWLELKRGSGLSEHQKGVHRAMIAAGQRVFVCRSMSDVVAALKEVGFSLHLNADNLATEYEARVSGREKAPRKPGKFRAPRPTVGQVQRAERARLLPT